VESVILVDETGFARGTAAKAAVHHARTPLHLAFSCYLFDDAGRFLLTRRAESKSTWPGVWTNTCCGHPLPGEPAADSVRRRLRQELGIATAELVLVLPRFRYQARMANGVVENEICPVYAAYSDAPPAPDPAEVAEIAWVDWDQFCDAVRAGRQPVSPWCALQVTELAALGPQPLTWAAADDADLPPAAVMAGLCTGPASADSPRIGSPFPRMSTELPTPADGPDHAPGGGVCSASWVSAVFGASPRASSSSTSSSTSSGTRPPAVHSAQRMPTKLPMPV
jgi:isopentenyl-diphosphate Delta-isomerase